MIREEYHAAVAAALEAQSGAGNAPPENQATEPQVHNPEAN